MSALRIFRISKGTAYQLLPVIMIVEAKRLGIIAAA
jgi:hypothetical protein